MREATRILLAVDGSDYSEAAVTDRNDSSHAAREARIDCKSFEWTIAPDPAIWLSFRHDAPLLKETMTYVYSGFSHVLWPIYVPLAVGALEAVRWRKRTLIAFQAAGLAVGLYLLYAIVSRPLVAEVVGKHIVYASPHFYLAPVMVLYLAATCVSCLFSSHGFVRLLGVLTFVSFVTAYLIHGAAMVSIWCFFAAILSVLIYVHLRSRDLGGFPPDHPPAIERGAVMGTGRRDEPPGTSSRRAACQPSV